MIYKSFDELCAQYPEKSDMTKQELKAFVEDCFDTYEHIGFSEQFHSVYTDWMKYNGKPFEVLGRVTEEDVDLEVLPMWFIRVDGQRKMAYPEEICIAEEL